MKTDFKTIYVQSRIVDNAVWRANADAILARYPDASVTKVDSHWQIPELARADGKDWLKTKRDVLVLGVKSAMEHRVNGRSADYIAASMSNGCLSSCQYCYVARRKGGSNPLTLFVNVEQIADSIERHSNKLGPKREPNQCDSKFWTYDIGCNADLSLDALVCDHPGIMIDRFAQMPHAKATFATKTVNDDFWLRFDPRGRTRIRYSIMPQSISRHVDIGTSPIALRLQSANRLVDAGYEVHLNFSPIIMYGGDAWKKDWLEAFTLMNDTLTPRTKEQMACEAFFLTHSKEAHEVNLQWNPRGEGYLWTPDTQVQKVTKDDVLVYDYALKRQAQAWFEAALKEHMPYCRLRYSF